MKQRSYSVDIFRTFALLLVLVYHCWVLTGSVAFRFGGLNLMVSLGGEIGVTAFFALSGYGIYYSISSMEKRGGFQFLGFMKKRCKRIVPHYYFSIFVVVFLMYGGAYVSRKGFIDVITHLLFIHNFSLQTHGSINGVLWTMAIVFQFYLIAYWLFKGMQKYGICFEIFCIAFTIAVKAIVYAYVLPHFQAANQLEFISGRQLITALDNFTIGMYVAYLKNKKEWRLIRGTPYLGIVAGLLMIYVVCYIGKLSGIHTNNISGYTWHSFLALGLGIILFFCSCVECNKENLVIKGLLWISKYEYGIYIWHLLIINNLLENSSFVQRLLGSELHRAVYILFIGVSILAGYLFSKIEDA